MRAEIVLTIVEVAAVIWNNLEIYHDHSWLSSVLWVGGCPWARYV